MLPRFDTVTFDEALGMYGDKPAWMVVVPAATAVTTIGSVWCPAGNVTDAGTVAAAGLVEPTFNETSTVGTYERVAVNVVVDGPVILAVPGVSATVAFAEIAGRVVVVNPTADAVIVADPTFTPRTVKLAELPVNSWELGVMLTFVGSLLVTETVTPLPGTLGRLMV